MRTNRGKLYALALILLASCGHPPRRISLPLTADEAAAGDSDEALIAYLSQPGANPAICDLLREGPHLQHYTQQTELALAGAIQHGPIDAAHFRSCINTLLPRLSDEWAVGLLDTLVGAYRALLLDRRIEHDAWLLARLNVLHDIFLFRPPGRGASQQLVAPQLAELAEALAQGKLSPVQAAFARELLDSLALEAGRWQGQVVDEAMMDALAATGHDLTLARFAARLPTEPQRAAARQRRVQIRASLSPFAEVRAADRDTLAKIAVRGFYPVELAAHPVVSARLVEEAPVERVLHVRQSSRGDATLLGSATDPKRRAVLAVLPLARTLRVQLRGISREVTVCAPSADLDPSPCVRVEDLKLDTSYAALDRSGGLYFREQVDQTGVASLATRNHLVVPLLIAGVRRLSIDWKVHFDLPPALSFGARYPGGVGPKVHVAVRWPSDGGRVRFDARSEGGAATRLFVEQEEVAGYRVSSNGGHGLPGPAGMAGTAGISGSQCSNGYAGTNGYPGGDGSNGGYGGDVVAQVSCDDAATCARALEILKQVIRSDGGMGGMGGRGGLGGAGGAGGSGRTETRTYDYYSKTYRSNYDGCSSGSMGASGLPGANGAAGLPGGSGKVSISARVGGASAP